MTIEEDALRWVRRAHLRSNYYDAEGSALTVAGMTKYLLDRGYHEVRRNDVTVLYRLGDSMPPLCSVLVPLATDLDDYDSCAMHVVRRCAEQEQRPLFDVWCEIKGLSQCV